MATPSGLRSRVFLRVLLFVVSAGGAIAACSQGANPGSVGDPVEDGGPPVEAAGRDAPTAASEAGVPGPASVSAKLVVSGTTGATGTPGQPFTITQAIASGVASKLGALACGQVYVEIGGLPATKTAPAVPGVRVYAKACEAEVVALTHFDVPLVVGTYPAANPGFPAFAAAVGPAGTTGRPYRSLNETTLVVEHVEGIDVDVPDWQVKRVAFRLEGDVPKDPSSCGPGSSCASGGTSVHVEIAMDLRDVFLELRP